MNMERKENYPMNGFRLCVDQVTEDISGTFFSPLLEKPVSYQGCNQLLLQMDALFDEKGYPQAFQEKRSFASEKKKIASYHGIPKRKGNSKEIYSQKGKIATMDIVVSTRRNTSWQGCIFKPGNWEKIHDFHGEMQFLQLVMQLSFDAL